MNLLATFVAILVGAPVLLTVYGLLALGPICLLGAIGVMASWARDSFTQKKWKVNQRKAGMGQSQLTPTMRFHLRRNNPRWNRNIRAT